MLLTQETSRPLNASCVRGKENPEVEAYVSLCENGHRKDDGNKTCHLDLKDLRLEKRVEAEMGASVNWAQHDASRSFSTSCRSAVLLAI